MVSISISSNSAEKIHSNDKNNEQKTAALDNIFANMFVSLEDQVKPFSLDGEKIIELPILQDNGKLISKISEEILTKSNLEIANKQLKSDTDLSKLYDNFKNLINNAAIEDGKFSMKFDLEKLEVSQILPFRNALDGGKKSDALLSKNEISISINEEELTELQLYTGKKANSKSVTLAIAENSKSLKNDPGTLEQIKLLNQEGLKSTQKKSKAKSTKDSSDQSYLNVNKNNQVTNKINNLDSLKNMSHLTQYNEKSNKPALDRNELSSEINSQFQKSGNTARGTNTSPNMMANTSNLDAQLKMLDKNWSTNLAKLVEGAIANGRESLEIQLDPRRLGKLSMSLSIVNNQTSIIVNTENTAAALLLAGAEERLAQMFESSGLKLSNFQANSNNDGSKKQSDNKNKHSEKDMLAKAKNKDDIQNNITTNNNSKIEDSKIINLIA